MMRASTPKTPAVPALLLVLALTAAGGIASSGPPPGDPRLDDVISYEAPWYNAYPLANGDRAGGVVTVEVLVDGRGSVLDTRVLSAPPLPFLSAWAEAAGSGWKFVPKPVPGERRLELRFSFEGAISTDSPRGVRATYENPLTLHVRYVEPTVQLLERVDGRIPEKRCEIHGIPMAVKRVPIRYGLPSSTPEEEIARVEEYEAAREVDFPNARRSIRGGCIVSSETEAEVHVCPICIERENAYLEDHPRTSP